jgi:hypothetical protein
VTPDLVVLGATAAPDVTAAAHSEAEREFGGATGAAALMVWSHLVLYYLWYAVRIHGGAAPLPDGLHDVPRFFADWWHAVVTQAAPTGEAAALYVGFLAAQAAMSAYLPGIRVKGLPIAHLGGERLEYNVNGLWAWYLTLFVVAGRNSPGSSRWTASTTCTARSSPWPSSLRTSSRSPSTWART